MSQPSLTPSVAVPPSSESAPSPEAVSPQLPEKFEIKVDGKKMMVTLDELKSGYGLNKTATERLQEAAKKREEAEKLRSLYSKKEFDVLKQAGWTDEELEKKAADFLIKLAQQKSLTPEQRAQMERDIEYQRLKEEKDNRERDEKKKREDELAQKEAQLYQTAFLQDIAAADKNTWLDLNDPVILNHIINDIGLALKNYEYDMPVKDAVKRLEEKLEKRGAPKKEYWKKLAKFANKEIDDSDLDAFYEKGAKGIREKTAEAIKRAEAPFAKREQTKNDPASLNTTVKRTADYYNAQAQKYRDLRYRRNK